MHTKPWLQIGGSAIAMTVTDGQSALVLQHPDILVRYAPVHEEWYDMIAARGDMSTRTFLIHAAAAAWNTPPATYHRVRRGHIIVRDVLSSLRPSVSPNSVATALHPTLATIVDSTTDPSLVENAEAFGGALAYILETVAPSATNRNAIMETVTSSLRPVRRDISEDAVSRACTSARIAAVPRSRVQEVIDLAEKRRDSLPTATLEFR